MQQCFFVNWSVTMVPREDKALPSIQVFFAELRRNFSPSPARQEGTLFLSMVLVVVITTDNNEYFPFYNTIKEVKIPLSLETIRFLYREYRKYRARMHVFISRDLRRDLNTIFTFIRIHLGSKGGVVVRGLASQQCGPGLNPEVDATRELSLLLVLSFALRGFSPGAPQKNTPDTSKFQFDLEGADTFQPVLKKCSGVNKLQKILAQQVLCLTLPPLNRKTQRENRSKFQAYPERFRCPDGGVGAKRMEPHKHCLKS